MQIKDMVALLNQEYGYNLSSDYYSHIDLWTDWWKGYHQPFHLFREIGADHSILKRELYTLKMAKKVCEDWAAILLNEKTELVLDDKASSEFLLGQDGTGGVFGENDFWTQANALMEKAFYSGTGAVLVRIENMETAGEAVQAGEATAIRFEYLTAQHIIPLSVRNQQIIEGAFVSEVLQQGKTYVYLELHLLEHDGYVIKNRYFREQNGHLEPAPLPEGLAEEFRTKKQDSLFAIIRPNLVNHFKDNLGLGMSIFADALDSLKGVDLAFNNFCRDLKLGGKKVFLNKSLVQLDEQGNTINIYKTVIRRKLPCNCLPEQYAKKENYRITASGYDDLVEKLIAIRDLTGYNKNEFARALFEQEPQNRTEWLLRQARKNSLTLGKLSKVQQLLAEIEGVAL